MVMVPHPPSSGERHANGRPGVSVGNGRSERAPGTPRKDGGATREKALQDPGLKDYRLGECLGKGAFGSVYKAFNWGTGEAVAIKQIKIVDLPKSELRMIEAEIDLLKNLNHDNIVKYLGFVKSPECLNIILEYCENGSLHSICKNFGKFPENLVGVYMAQILQGLLYLHDQGVIHRDIKGANILTTKDGKVKLADFGVSTSTLATGDKEAQVVGTPYWMAPEVIQLSGATTASDIWSLGCTVIELLEGKPPYHKLAPMPALFAIVNDDHPPLPEGVSPAARDFLMQCFQKDPNLRVSARKLLKHAWIVASRRSDAPISKPPANFNEAVEEVKQWNEALKSPNNGSLRTSTRTNASPLPIRKDPPLRNAHSEQPPSVLATPAKGPLILSKPRNTADAFRSPESTADDNWDDDFATSISPSALQLPHLKPYDNFGGMFSSEKLKSYASVEFGAATENENWNDNFDGDLMTIKGPPRSVELDLHELETIRPAPRKPKVLTEASAVIIPKPRTRKQPSANPPRSKAAGKEKVAPCSTFSSRSPVIFREHPVEDFPDVFVENDNILDRRLSLMKDEVLSPKLFHPSDLTNLPRSAHPSFTNGCLRRQADSRPDIRERSMRRTQSSVEIQRYAEDDDEDFSDIFGKDGGIIEQEGSEPSSEDGAWTLHGSRLSNNSWLGDEDDEDDPFASLEQGFDEMDLQANIARDKHARLCTLIEGLVGSLRNSEAEDTLSDISEQLLDVLYESPDAKALIIGAHGMLPILEILEPCTVKSRQSMILRFLKVVNALILDDVEIQEHLCFVGGIPIITKFSARQYSSEIRLEAAAFVRQMYQTSIVTLQMFISAGGLNVLVEFLDEDYDEARDLVLIGVNGISNVFEIQSKGPTPKNDFCRILSRSKILYPLSLVLSRVLDEEGEIPELIEGRIVNIFYLFSQAENYVKEIVADRMTLKGVLKDLKRMSPAHEVTMLKFIKNLSMLSTTLEALHSSMAIEILIDLLNYSLKTAQPHFREICNQVLSTMYNLCRLSKVRQEDAAVNGIIPLLKRIMDTERPPKEFALPILCEMAHSGKVGRKYLWQNQGLQFYISLLADQYWQVTALDAIFIWLQEETARVEKFLLDSAFTKAIVQCFTTPKTNTFDVNLLEPLQKLLRLSPPVAASLARPDMFTGILQKLNHKKTVVRLNLLRIVRSISAPYEDATFSIRSHPLFKAIEQLAENDDAILVKNMASELVKSTLEQEKDEGSIGRNRSSSRRRNSHTSSSLNNNISTPSTPTNTGRTSRPKALVENVLAHQRSGILSDPSEPLCRPRSRDSHSNFTRRATTIVESSNGTNNRNRLPRASLRPTHSAGILTRDEFPPATGKKENGTSGRIRAEPRSTASPMSSSMPQASSRRRTRQPSGEIKWT